MIITENINSPLSIDDRNLMWSVDFNKPIMQIGLGYFAFECLFWNEVDGEKLDINHRELRVPLQLQSQEQKFSFADLQALFYMTFPQLQMGGSATLRTSK